MSKMPLVSEGAQPEGEVKAELVGEDTPKLTHCPSCNTEINESTVRAVKAGKKMHMNDKAFRAVISVCRKCGHSFGFSGLTPVSSAYHSSPHAENKKREKRRAQKSARRRNRR